MTSPVDSSPVSSMPWINSREITEAELTTLLAAEDTRLDAQRGYINRLAQARRQAKLDSM